MAFDRFGGPEVLRLQDLTPPPPGPGEVRLRIVAAGVNPVDWKIREGRLAGAFAHTFPVVPGWEMAGTVEELGPGTTRLRRGDKVWAYTRTDRIQWGCYAEEITVPEANVATMPPGLLFEEAAGVPVAGLTTLQALMGRGDVGPGRTVLIHAAAGGVGHIAVQVARAAGARVVGTAGRQGQRLVRDLGVEDAIDHTREDVYGAVRELCPDGVDVVLDTLGGEVQARSLEVLKPGGRLVSVVSPPDPQAAAARGVRPDYVFISPSVRDLEALGALVAAGKVRPHVEKIYPLEAAAEAQVASQAGHVHGKLVLNL